MTKDTIRYGNRVVNHKFQTASQIFQKRNQKLTLQGMLHWGTDEFFQQIQNLINKCEGIILNEDTHYLDPSNLIKLNEQDFDKMCKRMKRKTNKTLEMMSTLLGLKYQWDVLKYPGPPHALCADASWHEMNEFDKYIKATEKATEQMDTMKETWDLMTTSGKSGTTLLYEIMYQCFRMRGIEKYTGKTKERMIGLFKEHGKNQFRNYDKAKQVLTDLIDYYGSGDPDYEPEEKAFWFDKREKRVLKLVEKIEKLDYIGEILILYGSGHFDALNKGLKKQGWKTQSKIYWTTAFTFPKCSKEKMMKALDLITC